MAICSQRLSSRRERGPGVSGRKGRIPGILAMIGPGIAVAATGVGAGDIISATVAGSRFGLVIAWTAIVGAMLKFVLAEGVARWQLATGTTILEGWITRLGRGVRVYFLVYLVIWSFVVGAALISACGLAGHAFFPALSYQAWGVIHSIGAVIFVLIGRYTTFENSMKLFVGVMFVAIVAAAATSKVDGGALLAGSFIPRVPAGSIALLLAVIGGIGGTITLLSYSYWLREKGWCGEEHIRLARIDLLIAYSLTGLFGIATVALAASTLQAGGVTVEGKNAAIQMAGMLRDRGGEMGARLFLIGFWGAVASSLVGVWQSIPYLFAEYVRLSRKGDPVADVSRTAPYRWYLFFLAAPPVILLYLSKPVWLVILYAAVGSLFMPFLAGTLLYMMNREDWIGRHRNRFWSNAGLLFSLVLFLYLGVMEIAKRIG